jgi:hypothetical protein
MSARELVHTRNGARAAAALCQWERAPQGGLRATWRQGCRVAAAADADGQGLTTRAAAPLTCAGQYGPAVSGFDGSARQRPIARWVSGGFIAALYLLVAFAGIAIVVRV